MSDKRVWFITGAGRGMGVEFAKAALAAGNAVVGTGRNPDAVRTAVGEAEDSGFFRTDLLTQESTSYATPSIPDYAERHAERVQWYEDMNGQQEGDPAKLARALLTIADQQPPPRRFIALAGVITLAEQKAKDLQDQANAFRDLSTSLAREDA
jgi:hypothetical protein